MRCYSGSEMIDLNAPPDINAARSGRIHVYRDQRPATLLGHLGDPLGLDMGDLGDQAKMAEVQGVNTSTLTNMASLFGSQLAAFSLFGVYFIVCALRCGAGRYRQRSGLALAGAGVLLEHGACLCDRKARSTNWVALARTRLFSGLWLLGCVRGDDCRHWFSETHWPGGSACQSNRGGSTRLSRSFWR